MNETITISIAVVLSVAIIIFGGQSCNAQNKAAYVECIKATSNACLCDTGGPPSRCATYEVKR